MHCITTSIQSLWHTHHMYIPHRRRNWGAGGAIAPPPQYCLAAAWTSNSRTHAPVPALKRKQTTYIVLHVYSCVETNVIGAPTWILTSTNISCVSKLQLPTCTCTRGNQNCAPPLQYGCLPCMYLHDNVYLRLVLSMHCTKHHFFIWCAKLSCPDLQNLYTPPALQLIAKVDGTACTLQYILLLHTTRSSSKSMWQVARTWLILLIHNF